MHPSNTIRDSCFFQGQHWNDVLTFIKGFDYVTVDVISVKENKLNIA